MSTDRDIYRSAYLLVEELGEGAPVFAANHAHSLLRMGDMEGYAYRNRIRVATYEQHCTPNSADLNEPASELRNTEGADQPKMRREIAKSGGHRDH